MAPSILLVDDSISVRVTLQHALTMAGFNAVACETAGLARSAIQNGSFDLMIIDVILPDGNGLDLLQDLRAHHSKNTKNKPAVILLSGETSIAQRLRGFHAGADDYIGKPYAPPFVIRRVHQLLRGRKQGGLPVAAQEEPLFRILLVDDSITFLNAFAEKLRGDGHDVVAAKSGTEALSYLAAQMVDAVVLDIFMPVMNGLEVNRRIKAMPNHYETPVMMLTGRDDSVAKATGITAGVDDYVVKSADLGAMKARLLDLLKPERQAARATVRRSLSPTGIQAVAPAPESRSSPPSTRGEGDVIKAPDSVRNCDTGKRSSPLFEQLVLMSGLPGVVARGSMKRALDRAGVDVVSLTPEGLGRALDEIRSTLSVFLPAPEVARQMDQIMGLVKRRGTPV